MLLLRKPLIQFEELGDAVGFGHCAPVESVGFHYGLVVFLMGLAEFWRHCQLVVEVGKGAVGVFGAGIEDGLGCLLDFGFLRIGRRRPGEVVVNYGIRIAVITLKSSAISFQLFIGNG